MQKATEPMIAAIEASIADLRGIGSAAVLILGHADLDLLGDVAGASLRADSIEIDQGDVQALIAALAFVAGKLRLSRSADASLDVDALSPFQGTLVQAILDADPLLGASLTDTAPLREDARAAFAEAAAAYLAASEAIRAETDDQGDDLLTIEPDTESEESEVRTKVGQAMVALDPALPTQQTLYDEGSCFIDEARARAFLNRKLGTGIGANGAIVDLAVIFAGLGGTPFDVRAHAPDFESDNGIRDADAPAGNAFPDPTFSGALAPALSPPPVGSPGPCP